MDNKEYYFITVFEEIETDEFGWPDTECGRCLGFYAEKETALRALHENWTDMNETVYDYAVIEGYTEGISNMTGYEQWFKFDADQDGYFEIEKPKETMHFSGWAFG